MIHTLCISQMLINHTYWQSCLFAIITIASISILHELDFKILLSCYSTFVSSLSFNFKFMVHLLCELTFIAIKINENQRLKYVRVQYNGLICHQIYLPFQWQLHSSTTSSVVQLAFTVQGQQGVINGEYWNFNVCIWIQVTNAPLIIAVFEIF